MSTRTLHDTEMRIRASAAQYADVAVAVSRQIHSAPELALQEHRATELLTDVLRRRGFVVTTGVSGLDTAFIASHGNGELVVAILAEYDALPEIGHACGHNVIAGAAVLAGLALQDVAESLDLTVRIYGTPAEESGGGKVTMLRSGAFQGVHAALMIHPAPHNLVRPTVLAMATLEVDFTGHTPPSMNPEQGRNAADAATLLQVAVGLLRQQMRATERISGVVHRSGHSPNVISDHADAVFCIRSTSDAGLDQLIERFKGCVAGAAQATGCSYRLRERDHRYGALHHHTGLGELFRESAESIGRHFPPLGEDDTQRSASTDFGNVSAVVPAIHPLIAVDANGASNHQAAFATACGQVTGDAAVRDGGLALALTVAKAARNERLRQELLTTTEGTAGGTTEET